MNAPEPYWTSEDGRLVIYHGDATVIVPQIDGGSIDLVLTDPPYGIDGGSGVGKARGRGNYTSDFVDDADNLRTVIVPVITQLVERVRCVVVTPGNKNFSLYPQPDSFGAFYQPAAVGLQSFGNLDAQPIFYYGTAGGGRMGKPCSYVLTESPPQNGHPCPKPLKAWRKLLSNVAVEDQTVLDPFMGSGTTLRAAADLRMRAIGIEINKEYCDIAIERLRQGVLL